MFNLPQTSSVFRVIPKNAFDNYTNTRQKKLFTDQIHKIIWKNKLSKETINLSGHAIQEIQIFEIELKDKYDIKELLNIMNRAIPYHLIAVVNWKNEFYISATAKHLNVANENLAVIDYVFQSDWKLISENPYQLELKNDLDWVFANFCEQLSGVTSLSGQTIEKLIEKNVETDKLKNKIYKLEAAIKKEKQFNRKVELNQKLKTLKDQLSTLG